MPGKLVSMKIDEAERTKKYSETVAADAPSYPWGLTLNLDEEALDKLDLDLPKVDAVLQVSAKAVVQSVSSSSTSGSGKRRSLTLQITHLALEPASTKKAETALYDKE